METVIICINDYFPHHHTPLHNLNEGFLENISDRNLLVYQVYK
jgi:hypothetical protein